MKLETIMNMPDGKEKYIKLENKLLRLRHQGSLFQTALEEWRRLYDIYHEKNKTGGKQ